MAHDVFISHSSKDKQIADAMCHKLENSGIRCWIAPRDILPGMDWGAAIVQAINNCRLMLLVFSANANDSQHIKAEVNRAASKHMPIVPFRIEDVRPSDSLEFYLSTSHWLDAMTPPVEQHLQYLLESVERLLSMPPKKKSATVDEMTVASVEEKIEAELRAIRASEVEAAGRIREEAARRREEEREQERREAEKLRRSAEVAAVVEPKEQAAEEIERRPADGPAAAKMTNSIGMGFVWIPPGSFMMGSENGPLLDRLLGDEKPVHQVTIREGFYMGKYEVTQAQWQQVMYNNPANYKGDNLPVESVSWDDAIAFIAGLNAQNNGYTYRLPSEAEWEYACRAGTTGEYAGDLDSMAWYSKVKNSFKPIEPTRQVGSKLPNAFGLFDMHGNVFEWCQDWHRFGYGGAPTDGSAWLSGGEQKYRVARGGSYFHYANRCRSAYRFKLTPGSRSHFIGFRVVAVART